MQSHKYGTALSYPNLLQGERYIRMFVADDQGPSISYRKGPMYVSIYVQLFGRGSLNFLAISWCSISQAVRFEDVRAGLPLRSYFRELDSAILAPLPSGSWAQRNSYSTQYRKLLQTLTWLRNWGAGFLSYVLNWTLTRWRLLYTALINPYMVKKLRPGFLSCVLIWALTPWQQRKHRKGKARQAKATRAKGTDDLQWVWLVSCWSCCEQTWWSCHSSTLGWSCPLACHSQPCHGCAKFILAGIWLQWSWPHFPLQMASF